MQAQPIVFVPRRPRGAWARLGDALRRHRTAVMALQWAVVALYALLVAVPAFLPLPPQDAHLWNNLRLGAQFLFWGVWWPFVILSVMALGRVWCGLLCPEGALTEFASRHGLGRPIPRWLRWPGWPLVGFVLTTVWGQLISVYDHPRATLLILGGSTVAAVAVGALYGQGRRVWCRYLCPVNGVFALLARLAPLHYRSDAAAWKSYAGPAQRVTCAPLLDLRHLDSAADCHACGRCSGHRDAITLRARWPGAEVLQATQPLSRPLAWLLVAGMLGVALGAFQWSDSAVLAALKRQAATWLVDHEAWALLGDDAPWWLLTHEPDANDVFTWLDGLGILAHIGAVALMVSLLCRLALGGAARLLRAPAAHWRLLVLALLPMAGFSLFVGLSQFTVSLLRPEGVVLPGVGGLRTLLLAGAALWSAGLAARLVARADVAGWRSLAAWALMLLPLAAVGASWALHFGALRLAG